MFAALRGTYVQFVIFMGVLEKYPRWFIEEIANRIVVDDSRYCFWTSPPERNHDYYEKDLIDDYSVVVRKSTGETHIMEVDTFHEMYNVFQYNAALNGGRAAFNEDCIEYVECAGGGVSGSALNHYPRWFYEYFTECLNYPDRGETYLLKLDDNDCVVVDQHCVFLRNKLGEVRQMPYLDFLKHYEPLTTCDSWWEECPF
jgi:hypothetical protein